MHLLRQVMSLRSIARFPQPLGYLDAEVLDQMAVVIVIKGLSGPVHRGVGQEDCSAP
jgi:hypothetical protein